MVDQSPAPQTDVKPPIRWFRRFWCLFPIWLLMIALAWTDTLLAILCAAASLLLIWTGEVGSFKGHPISRSHKITMTLCAIMMIAWPVIRDLDKQSLRFGADGFPLCNTSAYRREIKRVINNTPMARSDQIEALEVLDGKPVLDQGQGGVCQHRVLTNAGPIDVESRFEWIDKSSGRYFITVAEA